MSAVGGTVRRQLLKIFRFLVSEIALRRPLRFIARRSHEKRDVDLRDGEADRIDRRGERGFDQPPHEPFAEFLPLKAQRGLQPA